MGKYFNGFRLNPEKNCKMWNLHILVGTSGSEEEIENFFCNTQAMFKSDGNWIKKKTIQHAKTKIIGWLLGTS